MECLFCKIIEGTVPSQKVYEDEHVLGFHDIDPQAKVHVLLIPKKHIATMNELEAEDAGLIGKLHIAAQQVAKELGIAETGYRLINNCNKDAGQIVFHIHYHLLGGEKLGKLHQN